VQYGLFTYAYTTNLGDEVQSIAAAQFLPRVDVLVERDRLHWYRDAAPIFMIFNGWFGFQPSWPPPSSLAPLFVSFHAEQPQALIRKEFADYFRQYEPIGCRSEATLQEFRKIGVEAYFSACMTLTLPRSNAPRGDQIYAVEVDPPIYHRVVPEGIRRLARQVSHELPGPDYGALENARRRCGDLLLRGLSKYSAGGSRFRNTRTSLYQARHALRTARAQALLDRYARAKLVITSRLHCALPCLALGTPVLLLRSDVFTNFRFSGLRDFVRCHDGSASTVPLNWDKPEPNPDRFVPYAEDLRRRCLEAVRRSQTGERASPSLASPLGVS
jgi:hypothetical protein